MTCVSGNIFLTPPSTSDWRSKHWRIVILCSEISICFCYGLLTYCVVLDQQVDSITCLRRISSLYYHQASNVSFVDSCASLLGISSVCLFVCLWCIVRLAGCAGLCVHSIVFLCFSEASIDDNTRQSWLVVSRRSNLSRRLKRRLTKCGKPEPTRRPQR